MIIKPSMTSLLKKAPNKYSLVVGTAKRARQIADGDTKLTDKDDVAPVTIAADEIGEDKVTVVE